MIVSITWKSKDWLIYLSLAILLMLYNARDRFLQLCWLSLCQESLLWGVSPSLLHFPAPNTPIPERAQLLLALKCRDLPRQCWNRQVRKCQALLIRGQWNYLQESTKHFTQLFGCIFMLATSKFKAGKGWVYGMRLHNWFTLQKLTGWFGNNILLE